MKHRCIPFLYFIFVAVTYNVNSFKLSSKLNDDAVDLTLIFEKFWALKPHAFEKTTPLNLCSFIDQCCSQENRQLAIGTWLFTVLGEDDKKPSFDSVLNKCINSTVSQETIESCPSIQTFLSPDLTKQDQSDMKVFLYTISDYLLQLNQIFIPAINVCTDEEIHAYLCATNTALVTQCVERILHGMYENQDYESYLESLNGIRKVVLGLITKLYISANEEIRNK